MSTETTQQAGVKGQEVAPLSEEASRKWGMILQLLGAATILIGLGLFGFIAIAVIWAIQRPKSRLVDWHGRQQIDLNFSVLVANVVGVVALFVMAEVAPNLVVVVALLMGAYTLYAVIASVFAAVKASRGEFARVALAVPLLHKKSVATAPPPGVVVTAPDAPNLLGKGVNIGVGEHMSAWWSRVRGGEMGALPAVGGLIVLMVLFSVLNPLFLTERNIANLLTQAAALVTLGMALVFVLLLGEIDLAAGVTFGVAMAVFVKYTQPGGLNLFVALVLALAIGAAIGAFTGFFVAKVGVPSFVVTLGLFLGLQGVILLIIGAGGTYRLIPEPIKAIQNSNMPIWAGWVMLFVVLAILLGVALLDRARRAISGAPNPPLTITLLKLGGIAVLGAFMVMYLSQDRGTAAKSLQGVPIVVPIVLVILMVGTFMLDRTKFGRYIYAIGGNAEAARRSGVNVDAVKWCAFIVCSVLSVVAGIFYVSKVGSADASTGREIVLSGVAAAVVGGVSLFGGRGRLIHAAIGALVISVIANGLGLLGLPAGANLAVSGVVLILAATVDALARRRSGGART